MPCVEVCQNLSLYLSQAVLPMMRLAPGCPTVPHDENQIENRFLLSTKPDSRRKLRSVFHPAPEILKKRVIKFIQKEIPNKPIAGAHDYTAERDATFLIPARSFSIPWRLPARISDMHSMAPWMYLTLLSAERTISLLWPEQTNGYHMATPKPENDPDSEIYSTFFWGRARGVDQDDVNHPNCKLIIAVLAPWALPPHDMIDFIKMCRLPAFSIDKGELNTGPTTYTRAQRIWAKLWDDCSRRNCPFFVVSVYYQWIFGVFVQGWTTATITHTIKHTDAKPNPTVLQWFVYWLAASMGLREKSTAPRFKCAHNPDIRNPFNVAAKLSHVPGEEVVNHADWLETHHKQELEGLGKNTTQEWPSLENTWLTRF